MSSGDRDEHGLRSSGEELLKEVRQHKEVAPHSGAMFRDQYRNNAIKGYSGQAYAHDVSRGMMAHYASESTPSSPTNELEMGLNAIAMHLHATLPGPELEAGLGKGFSAFADVGNLSQAGQKRKFAEAIHEPREQVKSNWMQTASAIPPKKRKRMTMPSPPRTTMEEGGGYISPIPLEWTDFDERGSFLEKSVSEQREAVRSVIRPLFEPAWQPAARDAATGMPTPFHGDDERSAETAFKTQDFHSGGVASDATAKYIAGETPSDDEVRVKAEHSSALFSTKTRKLGAGAHEVMPTDRREKIAALPDHSRTVVAHTQADVRTSTVNTIFRGK